MTFLLSLPSLGNVHLEKLQPLEEGSPKKKVTQGQGKTRRGTPRRGGMAVLIPETLIPTAVYMSLCTRLARGGGLGLTADKTREWNAEE